MPVTLLVKQRVLAEQRVSTEWRQLVAAPQPVQFASLENIMSADIALPNIRQVAGNAKLIPELNTSRNDQRAVVRFDGLELFFFSDRTGVGNDDLFVSTRETVDDAWSEPMNLGPTVNSAFRDVQAYIASDRETLFFASNRPPADCPLGCGSFDLYVTTRTKIKGP